MFPLLDDVVETGRFVDEHLDRRAPRGVPQPVASQPVKLGDKFLINCAFVQAFKKGQQGVCPPGIHFPE
jgi:hypothetical protein